MGKHKPIVSVCCLVYNHEPYLRECFDGFVMQQTTFPIEILVHDDASTDHSADIIREYTAKYPDLFKAIYQTENQYSKGVDVFSINAKRAQGKYIALCEGDDYWTDPLKLQKQVDMLEVHSEYSACFHNAKIVNGDGVFIRHFHPDCEKMKQIYDFNDSIKGWNVPTASLVYRNDTAIHNIVTKITQKYTIISGDRLLIAAIAANGNYYYMPQEMSIYRNHSGGISSWGNHIKIFKSNICLYKGLKRYFFKKYSEELGKKVFEWNGELALEYYRQKQYLNYAKGLMVTFFYIRTLIDFKTWIKNYLLRK